MRRLRYPWRLTLYSERTTELPQLCLAKTIQKTQWYKKDGPVVQETARLVGKMGKKPRK